MVTYLFQQMCFNICINNTDDHLKNFSLLRDENGWSISPAYDLVPTTSMGEYHQLGFANSAVPPKDKALINFGMQYFNLNKEKVMIAIETCEQVVSNWQEHFASQGVDERDIHYLDRVIAPRLTCQEKNLMI